MRDIRMLIAALLFPVGALLSVAAVAWLTVRLLRVSGPLDPPARLLPPGSAARGGLLDA